MAEYKAKAERSYPANGIKFLKNRSYMNEKEQQLSFEKGITNVPSDALCSDNALADSRDLVYDNGEHKVIQRPVVHLDRYVGCHEMPHFLYVHKTTKDIYIGYFNSSKRITFGEKEGSLYVHLGHFIDLKYSSTTRVTSIGKTVIVSDEDGMHYLLWDSDHNQYNIIGSIPDLKTSAHLYYSTHTSPRQYWVRNSSSYEGILELDEYNHIIKIHPECTPDKYNDYVLGLYSKNKKSVANKKGFCEPFFIRFALEMFDGSYTYITNPILLLPSVIDNTYIDWFGGTNRVSIVTDYCSLIISQDVDYSSFSDVVKDVVVFATDGISLYDTTIDQELHYPGGSTFGGFFWGNVKGNQHVSYERSVYQYNSDRSRGGCLVRRQTIDIVNEIESSSVFYKIASIGIKPYSGEINQKMGEHVLENITTQEVLSYDDYYSRCKLTPEIVDTYNSRLNIANVSRGFFEGYDNFMICDYEEGEHSYDFYVTIKTDTSSVVVHHHKDHCYQMQGYYFYYPDSRASNVVIINEDGTVVLDAELKEHAGLNGAYYFAGLPGETMPNPQVDAGGSRTERGGTERLPNYIITSEVNNPWVFKAEGYNKVGTGKIIGMSTITQALSQGQFGQFPLLVFSESGIWAMDLDKTGLFISVHPMSREVCNNAKSITQTDGAVFFTSEKGLMIITGSEVRCVSEQLNGKVDTFPSEYLGLTKYSLKDMLRNCCIAYDYRDSLLWIMGSGSYGYTYAIKNGTFSMSSVSPSSTIINNYPDTLIQEQTGEVYSLLERPNINEDSSTNYGGIIVTRPMKFENALALKSLLQVRHITDMQGTLKLRIFASNNFKKWVELHSLGGMPWKYYRFAYTFEGLKATDRFAGSVVVTQERRTDKIR